MWRRPFGREEKKKKKHLMTTYGKTSDTTTPPLPFSVCRLTRHRYRGPSVLRVIMLLLAGLSRSRYHFHLLKELEEPNSVDESSGHAALQIITAALA